jgi:drug/metabolite transporter (DMT)-like permease
LNRPSPGAHSVIIGIACGIGAAICWACGFTAARHGIAIGLSPFDIAFHRYAWAGLVFLPGVLLAGARDLIGIGWGRGLAIVLVGFHLTQKAAAPPDDHCVFRWWISHCKSWRRE